MVKTRRKPANGGNTTWLVPINARNLANKPYKGIPLIQEKCLFSLHASITANVPRSVGELDRVSIFSGLEDLSANVI